MGRHQKFADMINELSAGKLALFLAAYMVVMFPPAIFLLHRETEKQHIREDIETTFVARSHNYLDLQWKDRTFGYTLKFPNTDTTYYDLYSVDGRPQDSSISWVYRPPEPFATSTGIAFRESRWYSPCLTKEFLIHVEPHKTTIICEPPAHWKHPKHEEHIN